MDKRCTDEIQQDDYFYDRFKQLESRMRVEDKPYKTGEAVWVQRTCERMVKAYEEIERLERRLEEISNN